MSSVRFVADVMLGSLSRWLRLFGFDTLYSNKFTDKELIKISIQDSRILLTRDTILAKSKLLKNVLLIHSEDVKEQIKEVLSQIPCINLFSLTPRCPVCNGEMEKIKKEEIMKFKNEIPDHVFFTSEEFVVCRSCKKLYWHGTHKDRINKIKKEILKELGKGF
uniref:Mut7-C RNAse domain-containing protein n=1 Tax=Thermodesulfovibrio aggregans TaxID=86166 RepID=A0A7C4AJV6_9BACT